MKLPTRALHYDPVVGHGRFRATGKRRDRGSDGEIVRPGIEIYVREKHWGRDIVLSVGSDAALHSRRDLSGRNVLSTCRSEAFDDVALLRQWIGCLFASMCGVTPRRMRLRELG